MALHVMDEANHCLGCKVPRCQQGCPIHTNIPEVIRLLKANKLDEAGRMLFENNPLTTVCSLVCNHENQCEGHCVRGIKGAPVHFSVIENYISSTYASQMTKGPATPISAADKGAMSRVSPTQASRYSAKWGRLRTNPTVSVSVKTRPSVVSVRRVVASRVAKSASSTSTPAEVSRNPAVIEAYMGSGTPPRGGVEAAHA